MASASTPPNALEHLIDLWLHGRSPHTQRAYRADIDRFLTFVATPLASVTLGDVQAFSDSLAGLASSSRTRTLAAVKSLLAFAQRTGYLPLNVGAAVKLQQSKDKLAERILTEADVHRMLALRTTKPPNTNAARSSSPAPQHRCRALHPLRPTAIACGTFGARSALPRAPDDRPLFA